MTEQSQGQHSRGHTSFTMRQQDQNDLRTLVRECLQEGKGNVEQAKTRFTSQLESRYHTNYNESQRGINWQTFQREAETIWEDMKIEAQARPDQSASQRQAAGR